MANYPQLDNASGVWNLREVYDAVMGGYWPNANNRAIVAGGFTPSYTSTIEHFSMITSGDSTVFGDLSNSRGEFGAMSNFTRCIFAGGNSAVSPNSTNIIDYVQFNTTGNAADFGDLGAATYRSTGTGGNATRGIVTEGNSDGDQLQFITPTTLGSAIDFGNRTVSGTYVAGVTSPTRVCFGGAFTPSVSNIIDFVEIATTGNAIDFGDYTFQNGDQGIAWQATVSNNVRAVTSGGTINASAPNFTGVGDHTKEMNYITIATTGNSTYFGDLDATLGRTDGASRTSHSGWADTTRGLFFGGIYRNATSTNGNIYPTTIDYITIDTPGGSTDFGELTGQGASGSACGNNTRALVHKGSDGGTMKTIDYVTIATTGNAIDFGDLAVGRTSTSAASNTTKATFVGGINISYSSGYRVRNEIEIVSIDTPGNATDHGDIRDFIGSGTNLNTAYMAGLSGNAA